MKTHCTHIMDEANETQQTNVPETPALDVGSGSAPSDAGQASGVAPAGAAKPIPGDGQSAPTLIASGNPSDRMRFPLLSDLGMQAR